MWFHERFELFYDFLFAYMVANGLTTIIQFGDLFDRRKYINFGTLSRCRRYFFDRLRQYGIHMVVWPGNHDCPYKNTLAANSPSLLLGDYGDCMTVLEEPTELMVSGVKMLAVPWICEDNQDACLRAMAETDATICLGHFEIVGFEMYRGAVCQQGLAKDLFWKFDHVYSGHFHTVSSQGNITYLGTPYQITWGDHGDERGFFIFDGTTPLALQFVANPHVNFHKVHYDDTGADTDWLDQWDYSMYNKTFVKVIVANKSNPYLFDQFIEALETAGASVTTVEDHKHMDDLSDEAIAEAAENIDQLLRRVSDEHNQSVDSDQLYSLLMGLHDEVVNSQAA